MKESRWEIKNLSQTRIPRSPTTPRNCGLQETSSHSPDLASLEAAGERETGGWIWMKVCGWKVKTVDRLPGNASRSFRVSSQHLVGATLDTLEDELFSLPFTLKVVSSYQRGHLSFFQRFPGNCPCSLISAHTGWSASLRASAPLSFFLVWALKSTHLARAAVMPLGADYSW